MNAELEFDRPTRAKLAANNSLKRLIVLGEEAPAVSRFAEALKTAGQKLLKSGIESLQINLGKLCNLTCEHCHVEAGPKRLEVMSSETLESVYQLAKNFDIKLVDLTGGAPEMCPGFKHYVRKFRGLDARVIVRSNLVILVESGYEDLVDFFCENQIHVVASLPCYTKDNVDKQRGEGVFSASLSALRKLNEAGFGLEGRELRLDLVYNPGGPSLPGPQADLERDYKRRLLDDHGIVFNSLICITNLPIGRFYSDLKKQGKAEAYDQLLVKNFNAATLPLLMCRNTLNVSWDGWVYDCDFNQMLELPTRLAGKPLHVRDLRSLDELMRNQIAIGNHCFGCTAGAGSSCSGELLLPG